MPTTRSGKSSTPACPSLSSIQPVKGNKTKKAKIPKKEETTKLTSPPTKETYQTSITLPNEIIHHILSFSASFNHQKTLASCCLSSKNLYNIASPILWQHLRLTPLVKQDDNSELLSEDRNLLGSMKADLIYHESLRNGVKTFSIYPHQPDWCQADSHAELPLPNLHTLHIHLNEDLCLHDQPHGHSSCRLLRALKPKIIVIHTPRMICTRLDLECLPKDIFLEVEVIIYISNAKTAISSRSMGQLSIPFHPRLNKVIWILDPITTSSCQNLSGLPITYFYTSRITDVVKVVNSFPTIPITIVNIGLTIPHVSPLTEIMVEDSQKQVELSAKNQILNTMKSNGNSAGTILERIDSLRFTGMKSFVEEEEWWRYLDEQEVNNWVKFMDGANKVKHED